MYMYVMCVCVCMCSYLCVFVDVHVHVVWGYTVHVHVCTCKWFDPLLAVHIVCSIGRYKLPVIAGELKASVSQFNGMSGSKL